MKKRKTVISSLAIVSFATTLMACPWGNAGGANSADLNDVPPEDTMALPEFNFDTQNQNALTRADDISHAGVAALSVGAVTLAMGSITLGPRAMLAGMAQKAGEFEGNTFIRTGTFPLWGVEGSHAVTVEDGTALTQMRVTGLRDGIELDNFLWFEGRHQLGGGTWTLYTPEHGDNAVLTIDWSRVSDTEKSLTFSNVLLGDEGEGDTITYELEGQTASMLIRDQADKDGNLATFNVIWDTQAGQGKLSHNSTDYCWDTLENGQANIECE